VLIRDGSSRCFEELGHQVLIGDAAEIRRLARRGQKNDHRDADLILELLHKGDFPRVHRPSAQSPEVLRQLRYRHCLVKMQTMVKNSLYAIALSVGLSLQSKIGTAKSRQRLRALALPPRLAAQRDEWLNLLETLDTKIATAEQWLTAVAASNEQMVRLQTHPGIGLITSLALAHILEPVASRRLGRW
jgi:transposase